SDGKINGRGATFQKKLVLAFGSAYREDVCGETGTGSNENGEAGNTMVAYNYPAAEAASATGSGAGIKAASCRTDAFSGSDKPYNNAQLKEMNGAPGATGGCAITFVPPFQPNNPVEWPFKKAGEEDVAGNIMSFPIGGSSVGVAVHLGTTACKG